MPGLLVVVNTARVHQHGATAEVADEADLIQGGWVE
jgi:hypothetical protein